MASDSSKFHFKAHLIDTDLPFGNYAQTALADLEGDGRLEYVLGDMDGNLYGYKYETAERWNRFWSEQIRLAKWNSPRSM